MKRQAMDLTGELEQLRASLERAEHMESELDRRVFHLKTLYDVSRDIFSSVESETILKVFLMMTLGNFGVLEGFILTIDHTWRNIQHFVSVGFPDHDIEVLRKGARELLIHGNFENSLASGTVCAHPTYLPPEVACALPFTIEQHHQGLVGLGPKLIGEPYTADDRELLVTLLNNLVIALRNAQSFEEIRRLNEDLQAKNIELQSALNELMAAMRKVEILESVKTKLSKFVPTTVCRQIDASPTADVLASQEQDVSILFLDIEGYTRICEKLDGAELNEMVEKYFSVFMDAIHANHGDVNETAGDGLMVLFLKEDEETNALDAVRTALSIRERATAIQKECQGLSQPLVVNVGIHSGRALVGAAKFESYTGSRWTYTARGITTNVAARIGGLATGGGILFSAVTAERVKQHFPVTPMGRFKLKNVSDEMEVFSI